MIVAVVIDGVDESNIEEAVTWIGLHIIMQPQSIRDALKIPGFVFYSKGFAGKDLTGTSFTVTATEILEDWIINTNGEKLEIPVLKRVDGTYLYEVLHVSERKNMTDLELLTVGEMIEQFVSERLLYKFLFPNSDYNNDYNNDYLI